MRRRGIAVAGVVIGACLVAINLTSDLLVDLIWFATVGYRDVFWTIFGTEVVLFFTVFVGSTVLFWGNGALAFRLAQRRGHPLRLLDRGSPTAWPLPETLPERIRRVSARI
jgi:uncharacterized protein